MKRLLPVSLTLAVGVASVGLLGCEGDPSWSVSYTSESVSYPLYHDYGPDPVIESGVANSCFFVTSDVGGRANACRVVDGYEEIGDRRNWRIDFSISARPYAYAGQSYSTYGMDIVTDDGQIYEGCYWVSPDNHYVCDYRIRKEVVGLLGTTWHYVLHKLWDWSWHVGDELGCASGWTSLWYGAHITAVLLKDCADGPL